jgi:hypothetical protein
VWLLLEGDSLRVETYEPRPENQWPSGCPTNLYATKMEVLDMRAQELEIGDTLIPDPVLVRDCPEVPTELVLRDDGDIAGGGAACVGARVCLVLEWTASTYSLPPSMKGYELYSWRAGEQGAWAYTLMTGTNRTKTWDDISAAENTITPEGWVKITVVGEEALRSVLDRLPDGEEVIRWGTQAMSSPGHRVEYPNSDILQQIKDYLQERGIRLSTSD